MRLPVPRNRLVTLSIVAALLTTVVTVGLANPTLFTDASPADAVTVGGGGVPVTPAADIAPSTGTATPPSTAADGQVAGIPTPNPDFTPAVGTATPSGGEREWGEHEEYEHEEYEHEEYEEHEEWDDD